MTLVIGTIDGGAGYISQDSWHPVHGGLFANYLPELARWVPQFLTSRHSDRTIRLAPGGYHGGKAMVFPKARMVIGVSVDQISARHAVATIAERCAGIDDFAKRLPKLWRWVPKITRGETYLLIAAGWSESAGRVVGYLSDGDVVQPELFTGTAQSPDEVADGPCYREIGRLAAQLGSETAIEKLHRLTAENVAWASERGRYPGGKICGKVTMVKVSQDGIALREICDLGDGT